ncbi:MAG: hypothetical protein WD535_06420 [Thermaerobacterales bacterium]
MTEVGQQLRNLFTTPLERIIATVMAHLSLVGGALIVFIAGWLLALVVRRFLSHLLRAVGLDVVLSRAGIVAPVGSEGAGWRPSWILSQIVYWFLIFGAVMTAFDMLGLEAASELLMRVADWIPRLLAGLVLLVLGLYISDILAGVAENVAASARFLHPRRIGLLTRASLLFLVGATILQELGLRVGGFIQVFLVALAALAVGSALAFGLGGRQLGADLLAGQTLKGLLKEGQRVVWQDSTAVIRRIRASHTELDLEGRKVLVPNAQLAEHVIELVD